MEIIGTVKFHNKNVFTHILFGCGLTASHQRILFLIPTSDRADMQYMSWKMEMQ